MSPSDAPSPRRSSTLPLAVIAIGGNSLIADKDHQSLPDQYKAVEDTCVHIADMIEQGWTEPISVLIADFNNSVPDKTFGGALEGAIGPLLEGAPFITSYDRMEARKLATE